MSSRSDGPNVGVSPVFRCPFGRRTSVPLTTTVRPLGAMGFGSSRAVAFDEAELEFLELVVRQVAVAVDNVLHDQSVRAAQQMLDRGAERQPYEAARQRRQHEEPREKGRLDDRTARVRAEKGPRRADADQP